MPTITPSPTIRQFASAADYRKRFVIREQIDKYLPGGKHFVDESEITDNLAAAAARPANDAVRVREILAKSRAIETLLPEETAALIQVTDSDLLQEMEETALAGQAKTYEAEIGRLQAQIVDLNRIVGSQQRKLNDLLAPPD